MFIRLLCRFFIRKVKSFLSKDQRIIYTTYYTGLKINACLGGAALHF